MNSDTPVWGSDDRYYAQAEARPDRRKQDALFDVSRRLEDLLAKHDPELRTRVERTVKQWNLILRDYLRTETALRLTVGDDTQAIPVNIVTGLPKPFASLMLPFMAVAPLLLNRSLIEGTATGLQFVSASHAALCEWPVSAAVPPKTEVDRLRDYMDELLEFVQKLGIIERIGKIDQDILGAYFFRTPRIDLYWMVIGLIAATLNVNVEALTVAVLRSEEHTSELQSQR